MAFKHLIGNEKIKTMLINAIQSNNILHSYLFVGIEGIGKSLFAKEFAKMILCTNNTNLAPCGTCKSCIEFDGESHPDFLKIDSEDGKTIKIEQIRYLQQKIAEKPVTSSKKVYIINNCDTMTREASNALLKTLEEPPSYATLILITSNESKLLTTIKSRCTKLSFNALSEEEINTYLTQNRLETNLSNNMIKQCQGSIGKALNIIEEKSTYDKVEELIENISKNTITQIWQTADVLYGAKEKIIDLLDYMNIMFFEKMRSNKNAKYVNAVSVIEEAKKRITANANYDMTIDNLLLKLWEEFN